MSIQKLDLVKNNSFEGNKNLKQIRNNFLLTLNNSVSAKNFFINIAFIAQLV